MNKKSRGGMMAIQKPSLVELAIERIKKYIIDNQFKPNEKFLSEKELVEQLQVSRTVVREALISLQTIGILQIKSGGGVYIAEPKLDTITTILKHHYDTYGVKIKELLETREIIELGALRLMIENHVEVDVNQLIQINQSYYQAIIEKTETKTFDRLFHQTLIKATGNKTYYMFSEIINEYFSLVRIDTNENDDELIQAYNDHLAIIDAIKIRNLTDAHNRMKKHFEPVFKLIHQLKEIT